ncbi:flagellar hook-length control protein FliK [Vibrio neptunius]|uniref:Flagellar hook-length control protein FliK n=1 Tax=Vibrio neptunius TaxID=170651 RepID=A0ABS3A647_9VIBR|nr:flagellar hook-length control protein FliK [Vibrio neptunius]MBN3495054.1 flagellar hook-length control protein FliK [Vibrio neptunius]MBN3517419.1 flagellar hook-length control protein FliK [Vibrio neptunius]MBN3551367.1 flagellar hook-length control protein FliK [Vibrio neptunius]MBN3579813.1 flagellar hook-length control protein FliK [Vibrio neptunius]MCH9873479.1 flagellar hook-length control protein FliK [Vibrio neptunius]
MNTTSLQTMTGQKPESFSADGTIQKARGFGQPDEHSTGFALMAHPTPMQGGGQPNAEDTVATSTSDSETLSEAEMTSVSATSLVESPQPFNAQSTTMDTLALLQLKQKRVVNGVQSFDAAPMPAATHSSEKMTPQNITSQLVKPTSVALNIDAPVSQSASVQNVLQTLVSTQASAQSHVSHQSPAATTVQTAEWAAVKIDTNAAKWGEQMMQVLHDRVSLQAQQSMQEAKIRLDPPELGKLDLLVRVDGDRLNVQINANAAATREALLQVSDRLRAELQDQNFVHVDVNVGSGESEHNQSSHQGEHTTHIFDSREFANSDSPNEPSEHWLSTQA